MSGADDLRAFSADLGRVAGKVVKDVDPVLKKGAQNIKDDLRSGASGSDFKGIIPSLSYDPVGGVGSLGYEIGPDKARRGGALGNIAFFGTSRGGGTLDLEGPLERERPNLERELDGLMNRWGEELE